MNLQSRERRRTFQESSSKLAASADVDIVRLCDFLDALRRRYDDFHECGCRLSDHGLDYCSTDPCTQRQAEQVFDCARAGKEVTALQSAKFASFLLFFFGCLDEEKNWTKQLHLGAYRNANTRMLKMLGQDVGFDSIGDWPHFRRILCNPLGSEMESGQLPPNEN